MHMVSLLGVRDVDCTDSMSIGVQDFTIIQKHADTEFMIACDALAHLK